MAVGYVFMFGVPLLATFSIDAILSGDEFNACLDTDLPEDECAGASDGFLADCLLDCGF